MKYIDYKERREQGTFSFPIGFYHMTPHSPRYDMQYHWHTYYEIIHIISGTFHLVLDNESHTFTAGDVIFITSGTLHGGSPEDCVYDCFVFDLQMLLKDNLASAKTLRDVIDQRITIESLLSEKCELILPLIVELSNALSSKESGYEFATIGCLYRLLGIIFQKHLYSENSQEPGAVSRIASIKEVLAYISENYYNNISLNELAKIAGMNPRYFCRYFKGMTERTPIDYLNYYRIECACEMLSTKDISIKETAISCGFNDESYFIKTFNKYKGLTPKQFMRNIFKS